MAPEVMISEGKYSEKSDVYSFGEYGLLGNSARSYFVPSEVFLLAFFLGRGKGLEMGNFWPKYLKVDVYTNTHLV